MPIILSHPDPLFNAMWNIGFVTADGFNAKQAENTAGFIACLARTDSTPRTTSLSRHIGKHRTTYGKFLGSPAFKDELALIRIKKYAEDKVRAYLKEHPGCPVYVVTDDTSCPKCLPSEDPRTRQGRPCSTSAARPGKQ